MHLLVVALILFPLQLYAGASKTIAPTDDIAAVAVAIEGRVRSYDMPRRDNKDTAEYALHNSVALERLRPFLTGAWMVMKLYDGLQVINISSYDIHGNIYFRHIRRDGMLVSRALKRGYYTFKQRWSKVDKIASKFQGQLPAAVGDWTCFEDDSGQYQGDVIGLFEGKTGELKHLALVRVFFDGGSSLPDDQVLYVLRSVDAIKRCKRTGVIEVKEEAWNPFVPPGIRSGFVREYHRARARVAGTIEHALLQLRPIPLDADQTRYFALPQLDKSGMALALESSPNASERHGWQAVFKLQSKELPENNTHPSWQGSIGLGTWACTRDQVGPQYHGDIVALFKNRARPTSGYLAIFRTFFAHTGDIMLTPHAMPVKYFAMPITSLMPCGQPEITEIKPAISAVLRARSSVDATRQHPTMRATQSEIQRYEAWRFEEAANNVEKAGIGECAEIDHAAPSINRWIVTRSDGYFRLMNVEKWDEFGRTIYKIIDRMGRVSATRTGEFGRPFEHWDTTLSAPLENKAGEVKQLLRKQWVCFNDGDGLYEGDVLALFKASGTQDPKYIAYVRVFVDGFTPLAANRVSYHLIEVSDLRTCMPARPLKVGKVAQTITPWISPAMRPELLPYHFLRLATDDAAEKELQAERPLPISSPVGVVAGKWTLVAKDKIFFLQRVNRVERAHWFVQYLGLDGKASVEMKEPIPTGPLPKWELVWSVPEDDMGGLAHWKGALQVGRFIWWKHVGAFHFRYRAGRRVVSQLDPVGRKGDVVAIFKAAAGNKHPSKYFLLHRVFAVQYEMRDFEALPTAEYYVIPLERIWQCDFEAALVAPISRQTF
jgi:hypothetical protein